MDRDNAERLHVLVSYAYWGTGKAAKMLESLPPEWNLLLDSGAFTNFTSGVEKIKLPDYIRFCQQHRQRFWRVINLDKIGDPEKSMANLRVMHQAGVRAIPVFQRGEDPAMLAEMGAMATPVCIGGISQNLGASAEQEYVRATMKAARQLGVDVHLLGAGRAELIKFLPWSADNSTWSSVPRFGVFYAWSRGKIVRFNKHVRQRKSKNYIRPSLEQTRALAEYDLTWADLRDPKAWGHEGKVHIAHARSWMRMARALARRNARYVFATSASMAIALMRAWELEKHSWPPSARMS